MREIIFRGKCQTGEWVFGGFLNRNGKPEIVDWDRAEEGDFTFTTPVDPETVGQYTGLKDRNGKMLFEWDLIRFKWSIDGEEEGFHIGCIHWDDIRLGFSVTGNSFDTTEKGMLLYASLGDICDVTEVKIIGNIHDKEQADG